MERVIFRHLTGSKANTVDSYVIDGFTAVLIGRDPAATVRYDAMRDDLVGRQHARIVRGTDDPYQFLVSDLESRNGTFVNGARIMGTAPIAPGDVLQFGPGGPELEFQIDPLPARFANTRQAVAADLAVTRSLASALDGELDPTKERSWVQSALVAIALITLLLGTLGLVTCRMMADGALLEQQAHARGGVMQ